MQSLLQHTKTVTRLLCTRFNINITRSYFYYSVQTSNFTILVIKLCILVMKILMDIMFFTNTGYHQFQCMWVTDLYYNMCSKRLKNTEHILWYTYHYTKKKHMLMIWPYIWLYTLQMTQSHVQQIHYKHIYKLKSNRHSTFYWRTVLCRASNNDDAQWMKMPAILQWSVGR